MERDLERVMLGLVVLRGCVDKFTEPSYIYGGERGVEAGRGE